MQFVHEAYPNSFVCYISDKQHQGYKDVQTSQASVVWEMLSEKSSSQQSKISNTSNISLLGTSKYMLFLEYCLFVLIKRTKASKRFERTKLHAILPNEQMSFL